MLSHLRRSLSCLCLMLLIGSGAAAYPLFPEPPTSGDTGSPFTLALRGGAAQDTQGSRETFALLTLTVALDRLARGALAVGPEREPETELALEPDSGAQASPPTPTPRPGQRRAPAVVHEAI